MGFTKKTVSFFLVVLLAVSLFTQNSMVSAGRYIKPKERSVGKKCLAITCTMTYTTQQCSTHCIQMGYATGDCLPKEAAKPQPPEYCCCYFEK
ncbi:unnamed protein product [Brassica rapa subsp. narinosa]